MDYRQTNLAHAAFREAVALAGGQSAIERKTGVRQQTVSYRLKQGLPCPAEHVLAVEEATGISKHDLRPDIYPPAADVSPAPAGVACDAPAASHRSVAA